MNRHRATICLTFDFEGISRWIGTLSGKSPTMISWGEFGRVGVQRVLRLLDRAHITSTFFVTGHTAQTFSTITRAIAKAGHELGHHGYLHEDPASLASREEEKQVLERGIEILKRVTGVRPVGYRSPAWNNSPFTTELLVDYGFEYDSSLMGRDFELYWSRAGDTVYKDGTYEFGKYVELVEVPVSWVLDDNPHFTYIHKGSAGAPFSSAPSKVEEIWRAEFDFMYREFEAGVFTLTLHPEVIGRGHRMLMLERLIDYFRSHEGVRFATVREAAESFRSAHPVWPVAGIE
jgi:peptidoglycan-N-acetylglucosamine deacetylase